jgi:hypothetical protein
MDLALIGNPGLREAIRQNLVSFPSQVPTFTKHEDALIVQLYFIRGWSMGIIADRYTLNKHAVRKLLSEWRIRAVAAGYVQEIHPELLASLVDEDDVQGKE